MAKKISIVTITCDDPAGLQKTGDSITNQNFDHNKYEWLVINGNPENNHVKQVLGGFEPLITWSQSEYDDGIYNAMNIGKRHINGEWIFFLNGGDILAHANVLQDFDDITSSDTDIDYFYGNYTMEGQSRKALPFEQNNLFMITRHQAMFYKASLAENLWYDEKYKYVSDFQFTTNYLKKVRHPAWLKDEIVDIDGNGMLLRHPFAKGYEMCKIRHENHVGLSTNLKWAAINITADAIKFMSPRLFSMLRNGRTGKVEHESPAAEHSGLSVYDRPLQTIPVLRPIN